MESEKIINNKQAIDFIKKKYKEEFKTESAKRFIELVDYSKLANIMEEYSNNKLLDFMEYLIVYNSLNEVIDYTKYAQIIETYNKKQTK